MNSNPTIPFKEFKVQFVRTYMALHFIAQGQVCKVDEATKFEFPIDALQSLFLAERFFRSFKNRDDFRMWVQQACADRAMPRFMELRQKDFNFIHDDAETAFVVVALLGWGDWSNLVYKPASGERLEEDELSESDDDIDHAFLAGDSLDLENLIQKLIRIRDNYPGGVAVKEGGRLPCVFSLHDLDLFSEKFGSVPIRSAGQAYYYENEYLVLSDKTQEDLDDQGL